MNHTFLQKTTLKQIKRNIGLQDGPKLNKTQKDVLALLFEYGTQNKFSMSDKLGVSVRTIERALTELRKANLIVRSGSRKQGEWVVVK